MNRWFRVYADAMRNPKLLRLSDKDFRLWVGLLAVAAENDGLIPHENDLKLMLGMRLDHLKGGLDRLISGGLIDALQGGYEPHHWNKYQYKSDSSTDRVKKYRGGRNVSVTPPESESDYSVDKSTDARASPGLERNAGDPCKQDPPKQVSPEKILFDAGVRLLTDAGQSEAAARTCIGLWKKHHQTERIIVAMGRAQREGAIDPVGFITGCLNYGNADRKIGRGTGYSKPVDGFSAACRQVASGFADQADSGFGPIRLRGAEALGQLPAA